MISINDLTVSFGGTTLLDNINFHINDRDRIGLVGKNGAGKSTLLKLIMGLQTPTSGKIMRPSGINIGYLPQMMEHHRGRTVMEEALTAFDDLKKLNERMDAISLELATRTDYESAAYNRLMVELNEVNDAIALQGSEPPALIAERTLTGLGFKRGELDRLTDTFSQGWNMRIELAKILLRKPDVLLLDEPTNHLDIESIQWLEDYLQDYTGALVLISHDRRFLDNCTTRTVEIMLGHIYDYKVPYSQYVELRKERIAQQKAAYENQQRMIEKTEEFIERFRYKATKSNQVQSRIKQLDRLDRIEIDEEDLSTLSVKFPPAPRSGDVAFQVKDAVIGYSQPENPSQPRKVILNGVNITIRRGEKVAFVGRNGEGKTTMMRVLMNELEPFEGEAGIGYNVNVGYYAQNQDDILVKTDTVYDTLDKVAVGDVRFKLRDILAAFLFRGEEIDKKVAVLSGGERSRLAMARLMLNPYNLLALDEPTNHMDIRSKDVLKQALKAYDGTLVVVSHDRDFLNGLVDKVYEYADGKVREHLGGVDDFLRSKKVESFRDFEIKSKQDKTAVAKPVKAEAQPQAAPVQKKEQSKASYQEQKAASREEKKLANRRNALEKQIAELEGRMAEIEKTLSAPSPDTDIMDLTRQYLEMKRDLDAKMDEWASI
ncbi:MAG: ABC-F family ATP-binding cassette domain-containing protein [Bacteroidales bacterium]|nr:ABC-F family ATP-binding cassette domain-containing protein [Bacteroidales bacterium]